MSILFPAWLEESIYAKYEFESSSIHFINGTWIFSKSQTAFRWECISIKGNVAELNISVMSKGEGQTIQLSTPVYVNMENRDVRLLDGTFIGKTFLWLPANPTYNKTVILTNNITAKVRVGGWMATCQGAQKSFWAENYTAGGGYDLDTGILIQSTLNREPTLLALGIMDLGGVLSVTATNIDLGPREWLPEIIMLVPFFLPIIAFLIIFILLLRRRKQIKKRQTALRAKQYGGLKPLTLKTFPYL